MSLNRVSCFFYFQRRIKICLSRECHACTANITCNSGTTCFLNEGESAASFFHQVAALVPNMFCNLYLVKNYKIAKNSKTTKAIEKISADLESLEFFGVGLTKFRNYQILLNKISHRFLGTTKLFSG
jgi:hypothetical protein